MLPLIALLQAAAATSLDALLADPVAFLRQVVDAARAGQWSLVVALTLVAFCLWARMKGRELAEAAPPWLARPVLWLTASDPGGVVLVFLGAGAGAVANGLMGGQPWGWDLAGQALRVGVDAIGIFTIWKKTGGRSAAPAAPVPGSPLRIAPPPGQDFPPPPPPAGAP